MKKSEIASTIAGVALFVLAAVFSISLLFVSLGGGLSADAHFLYRMGKLFTNVYGLCSALIPVFLIIAGLQCFSPQWNIKRGVILLGSIIPFFTVDALEHACRIIVSGNAGAILGIKLTTALLIGAVVLFVEYFLLSMLGDTLQHILAPQDAYDEDEEAADEDDVVVAIAESDDENADAEDVAETDDAEEDEAATDEADVISDETDEDDIPDAENDEIGEDQLIRAPTTLANGEDNPFNHVFDEPEEESQAEVKEETETVDDTVADEPNAVVASAEPVEASDAVAESASEPLLESADNEDFTPPPVPQYNESAPKFVADEDEPEELLELDTFDPESDSFAGAHEQTEDVADVEEVEDEADVPAEENPNPTIDIVEESEYDHDDDVMSEEEAAVTESAAETDADDDDTFGDFTVEDYEPVASDDDELLENDVADATPLEEETIGFDEAFVDDENSAEAEDNDADEDLAEAESLADELEAESEEEIDFAEDADDTEAFAEIEDDADDTEEVAEPELEKSGLDAIFAEMDDDAATEPVFDEEDQNVDPLAPPVVDANGNQIEQAVPIDFEDVDLEDIEGAEAEDVSEVQSDADDFDEDDQNVVRLEKPAPLVEEPPAPPKQKIRGPYKVPSDLLDTYSNGEYWLIDEETKQAASDLKDTLSEFKIEAEVTGIRKGPVVTMFEILPAPGVKLSKIVALQDNIALRLAASSVRIVAPIPGKHAVGIEVPNKDRAVVSFKEIVDLDLPQFNKMAIPVILGKDISGEPQVLDLAKTPHLLIAGSTGAGKSVCVNSMILSILYKRSPQDVKLIMIDPKVVELKLYNDIPHLLTPVITESKRAFQSLQYCLCEMERRYACLDGMGVRDIVSYNKRIVERNIAAEKLPYIVVVIDEFADLMATTGKELESTIARLAAMSRAVGIHLVLATQRPSIDVITGLIKANIPSRIAFMVASKMDSRIIIDQVGAEKLLGKGDMLFASATDPFPVRIQGTLVNDNEVENVVEYVKRYGEPEYIDDEIFVDDDEEGGAGPGLFSDGEDPLYDEALQIVVQAGKASASYIQRRLKIGYNRAARLVEEMEERGIVGPANGSKPREVIHVPS